MMYNYPFPQICRSAIFVSLSAWYFVNVKIGACAIILFLLGTGCKTDSEEQTLSDDSNIVSTLHFVLDNSASMKGYTTVYDSTGFKQQVADILAKLDYWKKDSLIEELRLYTTEDTSGCFKQYSYGVTRFSGELASPSSGIMKNHHSYLHTTLDSLIETLERDTSGRGLGIFVTDGILSTPQSAEKADNKEQLAALSIGIQNAFNTVSLSQRNYAVQMLMLNSEFRGIYHNYKNGYRDITQNIQRPYYIILIGNTILLNRFNAEVVKPVIGNQIVHQLFWAGKSGYADVNYELYGSYFEGQNGRCSDDRKGLNGIDFSNPPTFLLGIQLPDYILKDSLHLHQKLIAEPEGIVDSVYYFSLEEFRNASFSGSIDFSSDPDFWTRNNWFVVVKMAHRNNAPKKMELRLTMRNPFADNNFTPVWIDKVATEDDTGSDVEAGRTFGLKTLIQSIGKSLQKHEATNYFSAKISFNR